MRNIASRYALVLLIVLSAFASSKVSAQSSDALQDPVPQLVIIEEPLILDSRLADKGITPQSFAETLKFVLSAAPDITATTANSGARTGRAQRVLSSKIEKFRSAVVWTGEVSEPPYGSLTIGPVVIIDERGLRLGALSEISTLVRAQFTLTLTTGSSVNFSFGCMKSAGQSGDLVRQGIVQEFPLRLKRVPGLDWKELRSNVCTEDSRDVYQDALLIDGSIIADEKQVVIEPQISWRALRIPLAIYRGTPATFGYDREEYLDTLARSMGAIINQYPSQSVVTASDLRSSEPDVAADQGLRFFGGNTPYLALPFLQRAATDRPSLHYELGTIFRLVAAPRQAESAFRLAIASIPQHDLAHRDLGILLFEQRRNEEALKEFELARNTPGVAEKHASLLSLLGRRNAARETAEAALARGEKSIELQLLLARLDINEKKASTAIERLTASLESRDARMVKLLKEAATITFQDGDYASAEAALSTLMAKAPDAEIYMLGGRVAVAKSASNGFNDNDEAVEFFTKALEIKGSRSLENPELDVVVLELAEALFFDRKYLQAATKANDFLTTLGAKSPDDLKSVNSPTKYRYAPVANLLVVSSDYLTKQMPLQKVIQALDVRLAKLSKKRTSWNDRNSLSERVSRIL